MRKASQRIGLLRRLQRQLTQLVIRQIYITCVRPLLEYASRAWSSVGATHTLLLEKAQCSVARLVTGVKLSDRLPNELLLARAGLEELGLRHQVSLFVLVRRLTKDPPRAPSHLISAFKSL